MTETVLEFILEKNQTAPLSLVVPDGADRLRDLVAEALYTGAPLAALAVLSVYYPDAQLAVGSRRKSYADTIGLNFVDRRVVDQRAFSHVRSYSFRKWFKKHGVPE